MSAAPPPRKVVAIGPMPPEKAAYALARYSRSPDSIEESIRWVYQRSSEKFWEQYYFKYGHASIADLGHVIICFENVSELAAIDLEDEPLWDGQAKSSRYQDFSKLGFCVPTEVAPGPHESLYRETVEGLINTYQEQHREIRSHLMERNPRPPGMKEEEYRRTVDARAFDVVRYLLPLAVPTNVGQVVSIRTLEKQIGRLLSSSFSELVEIGKSLAEACSAPPTNPWMELSEFGGQGPGAGVSEAVAPTLARHARKSDYQIRTYPELLQLANERVRFDATRQAEAPVMPVDLISPHPLLEELATTLLYRVCHAPYRQLLETVRGWSEKEQQEVIEVALRHRGDRDDLLREFRSGYPLIFDIMMDIGAFRDLHRHRRCQQVRQAWTTDLGYEVPALIGDAGLETGYRQAMESAGRAAKTLGESLGGAYLIPFGFRVRTLFKMDFAEAEYISRLRSGVKGHFSYRNIAWRMKEALAAQYPYLASKIAATPPDVEEPLTR
ncbi:MAG TPA: FAD-dependent thymidylate synthase [Nitrospiria bacterium]|nr:FAD-dependent thymidylate synthase [Nitrospiria bacterium]